MFNLDDGLLAVTWPDGLSHRFHPIWLRERSFEPDNKDCVTGHRVQEVAFLPPDLAITQAALDGDRILLAFDDGHRCSYTLDDLRDAVERPMPDDLVGARQPWDGALAERPWHDAGYMKDDDEALLAMIDDLARLGFVLLRELGTEPDGLVSLTERIGPMRATNWGTLADVRTLADYDDLSMTGRALEPHCDNPYRLPGPGYIFLHCLENDAEGGESVIIDGLQVAQRVAERDPEAFDVLTGTQVGFHYADADAILDHAGPLIELGPLGEVHRVRFHNRAEQVPAWEASRLDAFYRARRLMAEEVWAQDNALCFRLAPGEAYVVDNHRLLHGRTEIHTATGNRHMRQCYMDRDIVSSRQKVLRRARGLAR